MVSNPPPKKGDRLSIFNGSFAGINVVFYEPDGDKRAIVLMDMTNQDVRTSMRFSDLGLFER